MAVVFEGASYNGNCLSFEILKSKITGIVGSSGSGKSDIVDLISGLVECEDGKVICDGSVGIAYQRSIDQFYFDNIRDNFLFVLKMHGASVSRMYKSLKMVGLDNSYLDRNYFDLSLSERKKISFALAISFNPKILVLDDVFFGMGVDKKRLIDLIRMMKVRYGKTIIVISRDADLIHSFCDDVVLLGDGEVLKYGDKYSVFTDDKVLKKAGIEMPSVIKFSKLMGKKLNKKVIYRDDALDLAKDIYRLV